MGGALRVLALAIAMFHGLMALAELAEKLLGPTGSVVECTFKSVKVRRTLLCSRLHRDLRLRQSNEIFSVTLVRGINADRWNQR